MMKLIRKIFGIMLIGAVIISVAAMIMVSSFPFEYYDTVEAECEKYGLDPLLIMSVIKAESGFDTEITSKKGAKGLMQITDETAIWCATEMNLTDFSAEKLYTPEVNIKIGVWYINYLLNSYEGNYNTALAAYNAGIGNVDKWLSDSEHTNDGENLTYIPFGETDRYVSKVMNYHKIYTYIHNYKGVVLNGD